MFSNTTVNVRLLAAACLFSAPLAQAESQEAPSADKRFYIAPAVTYDFFDDDAMVEDDLGYRLSIGKPLTDKLNLELNAFKSEGDAKSASVLSPAATVDGSVEGIGLNLMYFPSRYHSPFFGVVSANSSEFESAAGEDDSAMTLEAGFGYLHPLTKSGRLSLRSEYRFRNTQIDDEANGEQDINDHVVSVGIQLALGKTRSDQRVRPADWRNPQGPVNPDFDGDGVLNQVDECPNTPQGATVMANGCTLKKGTALTLRGVNFEFDRGVLLGQSKTILDQAANVLNKTNVAKVEVSGHTDSKGSDRYNLRLSQVRAEAVRRYLIEHGVPAEKLVARGYGESRPVAANQNADGSDNPSGRATNRRVELNIIK